ncbi:1-deoxy-D-xylulose-5-phosphate synthase [Proteinivorax hydrogeniformans]|uniref:1-deoxy-D-xylulose-5-phosphate synthase n=1 Tax=Proteinivorax hydrogeniformans TaxID=1826727 RepID=A0AAU8HRL1_9FIRM
MVGTILDKIDTPEDVKKLPKKELKNLAKEIREFLVDATSKTGGHLAPNLGVVELTIALHRVFSTTSDKIVWDVGHQSYVHKILTGRKNEFNALRQLDGLSGFPKTAESKHDHFNTGHSSTSISAALGMALSRDLKGDSNNVVAVIGDGAMTGGMAFEALNHCGHKQNTDLTVVLNDNEMSIGENVGGLSSYLSRVRTDPKYTKTKEDVQYLLKKVPAIGGTLYKSLDRVKDSVKYMMVAGLLFEELGFTYIGPIDGHDFYKLEEVLQQAKKTSGPVLVHVITKKGKGFLPAEKTPDKFHGVAPFDKETGLPLKKKQKSFTDGFSEALCDLAQEDDKIVAISAAMVSGTGLSKFANKFPQRFYDVGIAEQHAVTMAAGLAADGQKPIFAVYSTFLQRGYDQVLHDVCLQNLPVVFAIDRAGIVGADGETHQGVFDISFLSHIPNMKIIAPRDDKELKDSLFTAFSLNCPVAIRYPKANLPEVNDRDKEYKKMAVGKGKPLAEGDDIVIVSSGVTTNSCLKVVDMLKQEGIDATLLHLPFIKPLDEDMLYRHIDSESKVLIVEEHTAIGGLASLITNLLSSKGIKADINHAALPDEFIPQGTRSEILKRYGLSCDDIFAKAKKIVTKDYSYENKKKIGSITG